MDMTQCKKGDTLLLRNGDVATLDAIVLDRFNLKYSYVISHIDGTDLVNRYGLKLEGSVSQCDVVGIHIERSN